MSGFYGSCCIEFGELSHTRNPRIQYEMNCSFVNIVPMFLGNKNTSLFPRNEILFGLHRIRYVKIVTACNIYMVYVYNFPHREYRSKIPMEISLMSGIRFACYYHVKINMLCRDLFACTLIVRRCASLNHKYLFNSHLYKFLIKHCLASQV